MTLGEFFQLLSDNPSIILFYLLAIPLTALLARTFAAEDGHLPPWNYLYSGLIYLIAVPGIFSITLNIYLFLFERRSVFQVDLFTQVLPILSMIATLIIIQRCVSLDKIPGFNRLSGLIWIIGIILAVMWFLDRTHIIVLTIIPFYLVILILVVALIIARLGWSRMMTSNKA